MRSFRGGVRDPPLLEGVSTSRQARGVGTVVVLAPSPLRLAALGSGVLLPLFAPPPDRAQQPAPDGTPRCALSGRAFRTPTRRPHRSSPPPRIPPPPPRGFPDPPWATSTDRLQSAQWPTPDTPVCRAAAASRSAPCPDTRTSPRRHLRSA